jgi:protein-tyrosine-phosphatase/8-oxo-dGTP pyrophosphatase MutT (NUDIX family)
MTDHPAYRNVLIVCHANTSRSVIAHRLLDAMLAAAGRADIRVRSGGIAPYARDGMLVSMDARLVLAEIGITVTPDSTATDLKIQRHLLAEADLILVMTAEQRRMLEAFPEARGRAVLTLREFAGESGDVEDPAGQGDDVFRACRNEIDRCLTAALPRLLGPTSGGRAADDSANADAGADRTPSAAAQPWEVVETQALHDCRVFTLVKRRSRSPRTAHVHDVYVLDAPDWVNIVPLTADGHVVMVRQYRHGVADVTLEIPGGMLDATDVDPGVAARREMFEETGYDSERIEALGQTHPNPAIQGNRCHTFVAHDVVRRAEPQLGQMEHTEPVLVPLARIPELILSGTISHALVIVAFHRLGLAAMRAGG